MSYSHVEALPILNLLFQSLLSADLGTDEIKPYLATSLPRVERQDSTTLFTYTLREEATWSDGSPVTADDIAFTLKVLKAPLLNNELLKPQVAFIRDIRPDAENPRKFTLVCDGYAPEMELLSGDFFILPAYLFDPQGLLKSIEVAALQHPAPALEKDKKLQAFATRFNSAGYGRNPALLQGSGGYTLENWVTGQYLTLKRKEDWWGNKLGQEAEHLHARPERISFQVIPDPATALLALKNRQLDVLENIAATEYAQLRKDKAFTQDYALYTPDSYEFTYAGLNSRLPKFADKRTRQAIAHLLDVPGMIRVSQQHYATPTVGPIPPSVKEYYHTSLRPYDFNLQQAASLLRAAGWSQENGGWYKQLNGKKEQLTLDVQYRAGSTTFEQAALILQQHAAKINIPVTTQALESSLFSQKSRAHEFELFFRSLSGNPFVFNFKSLFHTSFAAPGGFNYTGFGTPESDALLDAINAAGSRQEKAKLLKRLQEILHEEAAFIPLYYLKDRLALHRRFSNTKVSGLKPNYDVSAFTLKQ